MKLTDQDWMALSDFLYEQKSLFAIFLGTEEGDEDYEALYEMLQERLVKEAQAAPYF